MSARAVVTYVDQGTILARVSTIKRTRPHHAGKAVRERILLLAEYAEKARKEGK